MNTHAIKWVFAGIFILSCVSLIIIYFSEYTAENLSARALPVAVFAGLLAIATAIAFRNPRTA